MPPDSEHRVVITGLGVIAPNGVGKEQFWSACTNGQSGVAPIRSFDASHHPVRIAAEVPAFDVSPFVPPAQRKNVKIMSRAMRFAVGAAGLAVQDSQLDLIAKTASASAWSWEPAWFRSTWRNSRPRWWKLAMMKESFRYQDLVSTAAGP